MLKNNKILNYKKVQRKNHDKMSKLYVREINRGQKRHILSGIRLSLTKICLFQDLTQWEV